MRHASSNEAMRDRARKAIADVVFEQARLNLPDELARKATTITDEHLAAAGILRAADEFGADLIVIGACGLGTVDRLLLGSVSREIVQTSKRPVLVVRPNPEHRQESTAAHPVGLRRFGLMHEGAANSPSNSRCRRTRK